MNSRLSSALFPNDCWATFLPCLSEALSCRYVTNKECIQKKTGQVRDISKTHFHELKDRGFFKGKKKFQTKQTTGGARAQVGRDGGSKVRTFRHAHAHIHMHTSKNAITPKRSETCERSRLKRFNRTRLESGYCIQANLLRCWFHGSC